MSASGNPYTVSYTVTVANVGGADGTYTLSDTPGFATGLNITNWTVTTPVTAPVTGTVNPALAATPTNGVAAQISATNLTIKSGASHVYTVNVTFNTSATATNLACSQTNGAGNGLYNASSVTGSTAASSNACVNGPGLPQIVVAKTNPTLIGSANPYSVAYTVTVANSGSATGNYTLFDTPGFPSTGVTLTSRTVTPSGGGVVNPSLPAVANGASGQISAANISIAPDSTHVYTVTIGFTTSAIATNLACSASSGAGNGLYNAVNITGSSVSNSNACVDGPPDKLADLAIQKNGPAVAIAGSTITYTLTLINNGLSAANGATFADTLPATLSNTTATCTAVAGAGTSPCNAITVSNAGGVVSGVIPVFPSGASVIITVTGTAPGSGTMLNVSTITPPSDVRDPNLTNNTSSVTTVIGVPQSRADLSVTKVATNTVAVSTNRPPVTNVISYTLVVVNAGPAAADGAVFSDTIPAAVGSVTWTCTASGGALCPQASGSGNVINQTINVMPMNGLLRYLVTGGAPTSAQTITNTATITPPPGLLDPNLTNNTSTAVTIVTTAQPTVANLSISKIGPSTVMPFGVVTYTIVATNNGPAAANNASIVDELPNVLTGASWTCVGTFGASCQSATGSGNIATTLPLFPLGGQATFVVTATAPQSGTFQNSTSVATPPGVTDPEPSDNVGGPVITTIPDVPTADLTIQKNGPANVSPNAPIVYTLTVSNNGAYAANGATFSDPLPSSLSGVTATCTGTSGAGTSACSAVTVNNVGGLISGAIPSFPSGGSVVITIRATAPASGTIVNVATVVPPANVVDPNLTNNTSSVTTVVGTPVNTADLSVTKVGTTTTTPGGAVNYVIDVVNAGPGSANGAAFSDVLPAQITGVTWSCSSSGGAVCAQASGSGNSIVNTVTVLPMNGRLRYLVSGIVSGATPGGTTLVNTATIATPSGIVDPVPGNNSSTATTSVVVTPPIVANLAIIKTGPTTVQPRGVMSYTLAVVNNGPASANGALVTDVFPPALANVTWTCVGTGGAVCGAVSGAGNLSLVMTTLPAGGQAVIQVSATAPQVGPLQNSARITPPPNVIDPDPTDNIGGPVITNIPQPPADLTTIVTLSSTSVPSCAASSAPVDVAKARGAATSAVAGTRLLGCDPVTATVTMSNIGGSPAAPATVVLRLPPGVTNVVPSNGGVFDPNTGIVTWPLILYVPPNTIPVAVYTVTFLPTGGGGQITSNVSTVDIEVTLVNNPSTTSFRVLAPPLPEPQEIPAVPWWLIAMLLAAAGLWQTANRRRVIGR